MPSIEGIKEVDEWTNYRKSTYSGGGDCVEVAVGETSVRVRDSKNPGGAVLEFTPREWAAFEAGVIDGQFRT